MSSRGRGAIDVECPACKAQPQQQCRAFMGATYGETYGAVRIGRFHKERVIAAGKATREANQRARQEAK